MSSLAKWDQVWDVFIIRNFLLCICILNIGRSIFNINPIFSMVVNILCSHAFFTIRGLLFRGLFLYEIILEPEKSPRKQKSQNGRTLFPETFYFKDFFHRTFLVPKFSTLFQKTCFQRTFLAVTSDLQYSQQIFKQ